VLAWLRRSRRMASTTSSFSRARGCGGSSRWTERHGLRAPVVEALGRARRITRGPKPARALHDSASARRCRGRADVGGVMEALARSTAGPPRGVQLYGEEPNRPLVDSSSCAGATVSVVAPTCTPRRATRVASRRSSTRSRKDGRRRGVHERRRRSPAVAGRAPRRAPRSASRRVSRACASRDSGPIRLEALAARRVRVDVCRQELRDAPAVNALAESLGPARSTAAP